MKLTVIALAISIAAACARAQDAQPEPLDVLYEKALEKKDDAAIDTMFKNRPYEVIGLVDGYLEQWLSNVEGSAKDDAKVEKPQVLLDKAIDAAARADKALGGDGYTRYAKAWKGWTPEQQKQFREGQQEYYGGRALQKEQNYADAEARYRASLALAEPLGDLWGIAQAHQAIGDLAMREEGGDLKAAIEHHRAAVTNFGAIRNASVLRSYRALAQAYEKQGDLKQARVELEAMLKIANDAKRPDSASGPVKRDLARISRALGDEAAAKRYDAEAQAAEDAKAKESKPPTKSGS